MPSIRTWLALAAFAAAGTIITAAPSGLLSGTAVAAQRGPDWGATCMTDDGYGRKRPCSSAYKAANPNWRGGDDCFTDEGYGRFRPCSANYKAKHQKK
ncbi:MAG TPA: hypothetical protein VNM46_09830 [Xanthobacteraceae bacterium]|jgi:hypothetical protein|nr:hypothetical protein [Xanthobacteraceae bacterium]